MGNLASEFLAKRKLTGKTPKIIPVLFKAQLDAHITHILQPDKTYARHSALSTFYSDIDGLVDIFAETFMGIYGLENIVVEGAEKIEDPLKYFTSLYQTIDMERIGIKESFLQNQIDEMQQLIAHTLYRLKNITS